VAAQSSLGGSKEPAAVASPATVGAPNHFRTLRFTAEPERMGRSAFKVRPPAPRVSKDAATQVSKKRSKAPVVGGMFLGAIAGFLAGNYVQHSACEYDCGPGGFTWGFTAIGAAGGGAIGLWS
jgi:hypothetical protein